MYVFVEIPEEETNLVRKKNPDDGVYAKYSIIHEYIELVMDKLNESLQHTYDTVEGMPLIQLEYEKHTDIDDMSSTKGYYMYDFTVSAVTDYEDKISHGYRIRLNAQRGDIGSIGVRIPSSEKTAWEDETIHKTGKAPFISDYTITARSTRATFSNFVQGESASQRCWGVFSYVLTPTAFLLFTRRSNQAMNIISFIACEDVLEERNYMWFSNGWRESMTDIGEKTKQDIYINQTTKSSPNGKMWLLDYFISDPKTKDIRWFMPNIYITAEHRMNNHTEYLVKHNNLSTGMSEDNSVYCCILNTLPVKTKYLMGVK